MHEQPNPSDHALHDLLVVAAFADRDATAEEVDLARAQIAACSECAALHADLVSLATATRVLPPIERPRDFRLRPVDAQRLRPNLIRRLFGSFGTPRDGFSRPLAAGLTTLGLAGLMLGILPGTLSFGGAATSGSAPAATVMDQTVEAPAQAPASEAAGEAAGEPLGGAPAPAPTLPAREHAFTDLNQGGEDGPVMIAGEPATDAPLASVADDSSGASQLIVISGTLLIIGLGLFALRWTSRRFGG